MLTGHKECGYARSPTYLNAVPVRIHPGDIVENDHGGDVGGDEPEDNSWGHSRKARGR